MTDDREAAWDAVHEALPAGWEVGLPSYSPERRAWEVSAVNERTTGRGKLPQTVTGTGEDDIAALRDLDDRLRGVPQPDGSQMDELRRRLRFAYAQGADEWSPRALGARAHRDELERVTRRYSGR
jgi:hypothetical protein